MTSGAQTFGLRETFAEPQVLPPPPVRHALFAFLVTLAAILHLGTAGWSEIHNGAEGLYAASAREMLENSSVVPRSAGVPFANEPPLLHWLLLGSYKAFGVNAVAARIPIALAFVASVALTFLIGERLGGYWRGFIAGAIYLCSCGAYTVARFVTPEPVFAMLVVAAVLCALGGYQRAQTRRVWFAAFWLCAAAAYLTRGAYALFFLAVILVMPALAFREARMRFRALFHWSGLAIFAVLVAPYLFLQAVAAGSLLHGVWILPFAHGALAEQLGRASLRELLGGQLLWLFPTVLLVLPGTVLLWRKVVRPHEFGFADAVPLCWALAGLAAAVSIGRDHYDSIAMWSGFALFAACAWDRISTPLRCAGIALVAVIGLGTAVAIGQARFVLPGLGKFAFQQGDKALLTLAGLALVVCCAAAAYLIWHERDKLAITTLLLAIVPIGLGGAESLARNSPYLSFARIAQFLQSPPVPPGEVVFEGARDEASSLDFYLERAFFLVQASSDRQESTARALTPADALERMSQPPPVYVVIHKNRVPWWQAQLTERFHIYHQVTNCGMHAVVNNHP